MKNIVKQIIIALLLIIAIALVFAIILYKYIPSNRVSPAKVTPYATPENIVTEITEDATEQEYRTNNETYEVTDDEIRQRRREASYNPGKSDPFAEYTEETPEANTTTDANTTTPSSNGANSGTTTNTNRNTTDNYYQSANLTRGGK